MWTKHDNITTSALTLNYKNAKNQLNKDKCVNRATPLPSSLVHEVCAVLHFKGCKNVPDSYEVNFEQLTHTVWTQVNDNKWVYYAPRTESMTVSYVDRTPVDIPLKGTGKLLIDPTCKGNSKAALLQPLRSVLANISNHKENQLIQVMLHNECCEELRTRLNLSTMNLNPNFRETVSYGDDMRYAGITVGHLKRHVLEHEWKKKHSVIHHAYSIFLYVITGLLCFHVAFRLIRCMVSRGTCQRVAGALKITSGVAAN